MIRTRKAARAKVAEALTLVEEVLAAEEHASKASKGGRGLLPHAGWLALLGARWSLTAASHREWGTS